ncbi:amidohydrolase [Arthrobacter mobilis]|uniref:Amidohydrolase n=1 Tax=Arthrobacter mobilis TaxID=2724944 RepID=A0A7X6HBR4_9MICC|nr:amidohydrolase [Arthrobacter mobilis]NKX54169.1 amidohydrolase [Arthrobacter mobilis]
MQATALTVGRLAAGSTSNVIPDSAVLGSIARTMDAADRELQHAALRRCAEHLAQASGARASVAITPGEPVLVNDASLVQHALPWLERAGPGWRPRSRCDSDGFA